MRLSVECIGELAVGHCSIDTGDGACRLARIPPGMRYLYEGVEGSATRMRCPAGVRLRFLSDTTRLAVSLSYRNSARPIFTGALLVDDEPAIPFGPDQREASWSGTIFKQPQPQLRGFDLWLPHMVDAGVEWLELDEDCRVEPAPPLAGRWLVYGDSITQGMTAMLPHLTVVGRCARALDMAARNLGVGGGKLEAELADTVPNEPWDVASIAYGVNDHRNDRPLEAFQSNAARLVQALRAQEPERSILLITPLHTLNGEGPNERGHTLDDYRQALAAVAASHDGVLLVAGQTLVPAEPQWFVDGVHPNDAGFERYAEGLLPFLRAALRGRTAMR